MTKIVKSATNCGMSDDDWIPRSQQSANGGGGVGVVVVVVVDDSKISIIRAILLMIMLDEHLGHFNFVLLLGTILFWFC